MRWAELFGVGLVLAGSALLNLIGLNQEGFGNTYYAAAVLSMIVGNERRGIGRDLRSLASQTVEIPLVSTRLNCLNVAAAAA